MKSVTKTAARSINWRLVFLMAVTVAVMIVGLQRVSRASPAPIEPGTGGLTALAPDGRPVEFPLTHTDVQIAVSGFLARATVTQTFSNPSDRRIEAVYVFPLPANAAVDDMTMEIGRRVIRGSIKERKEAARIYEEAKHAGKTASLLTQERPNIFTQAVANILPGDTIRITISYVQTLKYEKGTLSMAFPMVVGPRYIPGASVLPDGTVSPLPGARQAVPDADRITPPVLRPGTRSGHDIAVTVALGAGIPFRDLRSKSHEVVITTVDASNALVRLSPADSIPNKDFLLSWDVDPKRVATGLLAHRHGADGFFSLMLVPASLPAPADVRPKEMVFVLDCSGSMNGRPIDQAKALVRHALGNLNPHDTFQIMNFSMSASGMAAAPLPNTPANVARGLAYLDTLRGEGGTEMIQGVRAALAFPDDPERLRVVMFLTDGYIGNERQILGEIRKTIGNARLYSFGVGSSVNRYLLENMALEGRGAVRYVGYDEDATGPVARFYDQVRSPVLTDIAIDWDGLEVTDLYPARVPDLFAGQPLLVSGRYTRGGDAHVKVRGRIGREEVVLPADVSLPDIEARNTVLRSLWARQAIEERMRFLLKGSDASTVTEIVDLSVRHRVLSQYTAFVAVEEKVRTNERGEPVRVEVPVELPDGVSFDGVFGKDEDAEQGIATGRGGRMAGGGAGLVARKSAVHGILSGGGYGMGTGLGGGGIGSIGTRTVAAMPSAAPAPVAPPVASTDAKAKPKEAVAAVSVRVNLLSSRGGFATTLSVEFARVRASIEQAIRMCVGRKAVPLPAALVVEVISDAKGAIGSVKVLNPPTGFDKSLTDCIERSFRSVTATSAGTARFEIRFR